MTDIVIHITKNFNDIDINLSRLKKLVRVVCRRFAAEKIKDTRYEISIAIVGNNQIRRLNRQFGKKLAEVVRIGGKR